MPDATTTRNERQRSILALLALITSSDLSHAVEVWNAHAPPAYRGMASAVRSTRTIAPANRFWFDPHEARYGFGTQGYVTENAVRHALNVFNANAASAIASATLAMNLDQWQQGMQRAIKDAQIVNSAIGRGGVLSLTSQDHREIADAIEYQYGRLDRFAGQREMGSVSDEIAAKRSGNYARAAISTFSEMQRTAATVAGFTEEINILGNAEHCRPDPRRPHIPDCPGLSGQGWVKIGTLAPIGERLCVWNCKCNISYRK